MRRAPPSAVRVSVPLVAGAVNAPTEASYPADFVTEVSPTRTTRPPPLTARIASARSPNGDAAEEPSPVPPSLT